MSEAHVIEYLPLAALKPDPRNPRTHSKKQVQQIAESIQSSGYFSPILAEEDSLIICGHGRYRAACGPQPDRIRGPARRHLACCAHGGERADAIVSDPPYNVTINGFANEKGRHREFPMASGEMSPKEFIEFIRKFILVFIAYSRDGAVNFLFMDWRHIEELIAVGTRALRRIPEPVRVEQEQRGHGFALPLQA